jgi:hypothetical protein
MGRYANTDAVNGRVRPPRCVLAPRRRTGVVDRPAFDLHSHDHRHVLHLELVDRLHAEIFEGDKPRRLDGFGYQVCGAPTAIMNAIMNR